MTEIGVDVDVNDRRGPINPMVYGLNQRYTLGGCGAWDGSCDQPHADFLAAASPLRIGSLRFPGGAVANPFRWRHAVGPQAERKPTISGLDGRPLTTEYGPVEHLTVCRALGAEPVMLVNCGSAHPDEAAAWVGYMNAPDDGRSEWARLRAEHGRTEPFGVRYWELGNEFHRAHDGSTNTWIQFDEERYVRGGTQRQPLRQVVRADDWSEEAGLSTGGPDQRFNVRFPPVRLGSLTLFVDNQPWIRVPELATTGCGPYFALDETTGEIRFGDGVHGTIPRRGARITSTYDAGPLPGFVDFYRAMKSMDPTIRVGSNLSSERALELLLDEGAVDFVTVHHYVDVARPSVEETRRRLWLASGELGEVVDYARERLRRAGPRAAQVELLVTEYNIRMHYGATPPVPGYFYSLDHAIFVAAALKALVERDVTAASLHTLLDLPPEEMAKIAEEFGVTPFTWGVLEPAPSYRPRLAARVLGLYAGALTGELVSTRIDGAWTGEADSASVPMIEAVAARDDGRAEVVVMLLNRDPARPAMTTLSTRGWIGEGISIHRLHGTPDGAHGTTTHGEIVQDVAARTACGDWTFPLPPSTVTCVRVSGASG
jgi:alpha-N-arabinofuranosidase